MKKAILTVGLFSMMMVLTSFTGKEPSGKTESILSQNLPSDHRGGTGTIPATGKKLDMQMIETNARLESGNMMNIYSAETGTVLSKRNKID